MSLGQWILSALLVSGFSTHANAQTCEESMNQIFLGNVYKNLPNDATYLDPQISLYGLDCQILPRYRALPISGISYRRFSNLKSCSRKKQSNAPALINLELTYSNPDNYTKDESKKISTTTNDKNEWIVKIDTKGAAGTDLTEYIWSYENVGGEMKCQLKEIRSESTFAGRTGSGSSPSSSKSVKNFQTCKEQLDYARSLPKDADFKGSLEDKNYLKLLDTYAPIALKEASREDSQRYNNAMKRRDTELASLKKQYDQFVLENPNKRDSKKTQKKFSSSYVLTRIDRSILEAKATAVNNWALLQKIRRDSCEFLNPYFAKDSRATSVQGSDKGNNDSSSGAK